MRVAVINGSPRGKYSTTLHSVMYLAKHFPEDEFSIVETASRVKSLEKDISPLIESISAADIILFSYPVYTFLAPYQLQQAISLLKKAADNGRFRPEGKFAAQITTSKHFYDVTAHKYIEENVRDMGMKYLRGLYADMDDLTTDKGRKELLSFWEFVRFMHACENGKDYLAYAESRGWKTDGLEKHDIAIITDCNDDPVLKDMIDRFRQCCQSPTRIVNIGDFNFKGGCTSCFNCTSDGICIYNDGFGEFLGKNVYNASAIVYAFRITDHSMGPRFKLFDDRQFCNGHRMMTIGMPVGYLVAGDIDKESNLRMVMEARAEVGKNILCRIISCPENAGVSHGNGKGDQMEANRPVAGGNDKGSRYEKDGSFGSNGETEIKRLADELVFVLERKIVQPQNFYGTGGTKIFRDLIWLMRGLMPADHKFYKSHGIYDDFPQRHIGRMLQIKLIGFLFNNKKIRKKIGNRINEGMIEPYKKAINDN